MPNKVCRDTLVCHEQNFSVSRGKWITTINQKLYELKFTALKLLFYYLSQNLNSKEKSSLREISEISRKNKRVVILHSLRLNRLALQVRHNNLNVNKINVYVFPWFSVAT